MALEEKIPKGFNTIDSIIHTRQGLLELIDTLPMAIAVINADSQVMLANQLTCQFVNKNAIQLIGHVGGEALGCVYHNEAPEGCGFGHKCLKCTLRKTVTDTMLHKKPHRMVETTMVFKNRGETDIRISTQPMILQKEAVVLLTIEDITQIKKYERTQLEKERLTAVLQTAGAVCHEITQPLMILTGQIDLMLLDTENEVITENQLLNLRKQLERLGRMSQKMMKITRVETKPYLDREIIDIDASSNMRIC